MEVGIYGACTVRSLCCNSSELLWGIPDECREKYEQSHRKYRQYLLAVPELLSAVSGFIQCPAQ